ncbi:MAG TPA: hypothetical protein VNY27_00545 [Solirubrobacteraceae bacterium]|jgi:hypothetical protein|nr:hypothetical protein [Solirubrobacteraceae bacterium]
MAGDELFIGWGPVVRGREQTALKVFQETIEFHGALQQEGKIDGFDAHLIAPHGGDLAGFIMLHGDRAKLDDVRNSEDFERLIARAGSVVDQVGVLNAYSGEALGQTMGRFQAASAELA